MTRSGWRLLAVLLSLVVGLAGVSAAAAQTAPNDSADGCNGSWQTRFGVHILVLDCAPGYATEHDVAYMYARAPVDTGADWHSQLNFTDSVWLFDAGARGKASLIIDFHKESQGLVADLYDDPKSSGEIHFGLERGYPRSVANRFPTMKVVAPDGWWVRDGKVNFNLKIDVDGPILAAFNSEVFQDAVSLDGVPDVTIEVHDPDNTGRPKWEIVQAQPPIADSSAIMRTLLMVNPRGDEPTAQTYIFWPYLGHLGGVPRPDLFPPGSRAPLWTKPAGYGIVKLEGQPVYPPIEYEWDKAHIKYVGEFVASRAAHNWYVYSILPFARNGSTAADFENPFAFYDLAGANDGYPDLAIRDEHLVVDDPYAQPPMTGPFNSIRYSWDQFHTHNWSFKVDLFGRRPMPATVTLDEAVALRTVPYDDYPRWATTNDWQAANFMAVERKGYWTSEGIYSDYCTCFDGYFFGQSTVRPPPNPDGIEEGVRAETAPDLNDAPRLYMGAVDHKLHLLKATAGFWRMNEHDGMSYGAIGGPIINQWQRTVDGAVSQSLYRLADRMVYADKSGLKIARADGPETLFYSKPPADPNEWAELGRQLKSVQPLGDGTDLETLFAQFPSDRVELPGTMAWDFRSATDGFRFTMQVNGPVADVPWTANAVAGAYVVTYKKGSGFSMRPFTPGQVTLGQPQVHGDQPSEILQARLAVQVHNDGDEDLLGLPVMFYGARGALARQPIAWTTVDVPAGETRMAEAMWAPANAGTWKVQATAVGRGGTTSDAVSITVLPAPLADAGSLLASQGLSGITTGAMTATLTLVVAIAVGLGSAVWARSARTR